MIYITRIIVIIVRNAKCVQKGKPIHSGNMQWYYEVTHLFSTDYK